MKITLKELRSIIRESVRQHLKKSELEQSLEEKAEQISNSFEEYRTHVNEEKFEDANTKADEIRTVLDSFLKGIEMEMEKSEDRDQLENLNKLMVKVFRATSLLGNSYEYSRIKGEIANKLRTPEERAAEADRLGRQRAAGNLGEFLGGPGHFGPDGRYTVGGNR